MADVFELDELVNLEPFRPVENFDEGMYHIQVKGKGEKYSDKSYKYVLQIIEGAKKGGEFWSFRNIVTKESDEKQKRGLKTDLMAFGITSEQMKGKKFNYESTLDGKKAWVHYTPPIDYKSNDPKEKYPVIRFILPDQVEPMKARYAAGAVSTGSQKSNVSTNGATAHVEQPASDNVELGEL